MKHIAIIAIASLSMVSCQEKKVEQKLALAGSFCDNIVIIDKATGAKEWEYTLPSGSECNSICVTESGDVLFSYRNGVRLVDRVGATIFDFGVAQNSEAQTARLIADDRILVGVCASPMRIVELDMKGNVLTEVNYDLGISEPHAQFRQIAKSENGNYLVPIISLAKVMEISPNGELVASFDVPASPFSVKEFANGDLMVSTESGGVVVVDRKGAQPLKTLASGVIAGRDTLKFATEAIKTDGGLIVANWQGHGLNTDAQLLEIDDKGAVTYRLQDTAMIRYVSAFYPFETTAK